MKYIILLFILALASCTSQKSKVQEQESQLKKYYIIDSDTIAELLNVDTSINSADILTTKRYQSNDGFLVSAIVRKLTPDQDDKLTYFLYSKDDREQWYASFHNGHLSIKDATGGSINFGEINKSGVDFINIFLATIDMANQKLNRTKDETLKNNLINFQKKNFPKAREEYYKNAKKELFRKDITVKYSGRTIKFYGYMFIRNAVIEDTFTEIEEELVKLRFTKVHFGVSEGLNEYSYTLDSKKDSQL
jgi:hypothetical protein